MDRLRRLTDGRRRRGDITVWFDEDAIGDGLRARCFCAQKLEAMIGVYVLNRMIGLGLGRRASR